VTRIHIALEDFDSGMSSLAYLEACNVRVTRIADVFVRDLATDARRRAALTLAVATSRSRTRRRSVEGITNLELREASEVGVRRVQRGHAVLEQD
jgi:EAL domain-containing protein (putative c-di-GMP-specific phosphodiesterase class I)